MNVYVALQRDYVNPNYKLDSCKSVWLHFTFNKFQKFIKFHIHDIDYINLCHQIYNLIIILRDIINHSWLATDLIFGDSQAIYHINTNNALSTLFVFSLKEISCNQLKTIDKMNYKIS